MRAIAEEVNVDRAVSLPIAQRRNASAFWTVLKVLAALGVQLVAKQAADS
jgi:hypothetical protein